LGHGYPRPRHRRTEHPGERALVAVLAVFGTRRSGSQYRRQPCRAPVGARDLCRGRGVAAGAAGTAHDAAAGFPGERGPRHRLVREPCSAEKSGNCTRSPGTDRARSPRASAAVASGDPTYAWIRRAQTDREEEPWLDQGGPVFTWARGLICHEGGRTDPPRGCRGCMEIPTDTSCGQAGRVPVAL